MGFLPPQLRLAVIFAKMARDHGPKLVHANNTELLTRDLGDALVRQKNALADPAKGTILTAYDVLPIILEVKIMTTVVARKMGIDTKAKPMIDVLEEIIKKSEDSGNGQFATGIKSTLGWTRALFADPDIQAVLKMPMTEIDTPDLSLKGAGKFFLSLAGRSQDEFVRVQEFLKHAKDVKEPPAAPTVEATPAAKPDVKPEAPKAPEAVEKKKPAAPKKHKPKTPKPPKAA